MYTIRQDWQSETVIEKSRFICTLKKVSTEAEAHDFIKAIKKQYWDATHNCSAYIVDEKAQRSSDDGEPSGTAGIPMLEVLRKNELFGVAAVVTRYFGGIKLGAGGLVRAYTGSVANAVKEVGLAQQVKMTVYALSAAPAEAGRIMNILYNQNIFQIADAEYAERVRIMLYMPAEKLGEAEAWLTEALNKQTTLDEVRSEFVEVPVEK